MKYDHPSLPRIDMLKPDTYAMMNHYFSTMEVDDWQKRRNRLNCMISDSAMICQVMSGNTGRGMALLNKEEFVNRMPVPSGSLKNIEILGSVGEVKRKVWSVFQGEIKFE